MYGPINGHMCGYMSLNGSTTQSINTDITNLLELFSYLHDITGEPFHQQLKKIWLQWRKPHRVYDYTTSKTENILINNLNTSESRKDQPLNSIFLPHDKSILCFQTVHSWKRKIMSRKKNHFHLFVLYQVKNAIHNTIKMWATLQWFGNVNH